MAKSIRLNDNAYLDSSSIVHNQNKLSDILSFSYDEEVVGTWFDGRKVYRKSFYRSKLINGFSEVVNHGISNVDIIWCDSQKSFAIWQNGNTCSLLFVNTVAGNGIEVADVNAISYTIRSTMDRSNLRGYITFLYVKNE